MTDTETIAIAWQRSRENTEDTTRVLRAFCAARDTKLPEEVIDDQD